MLYTCWRAARTSHPGYSKQMKRNISVSGYQGSNTPLCAPSSSSLCFPCDDIGQKRQSLVSFLESPSWPNGIPPAVELNEVESRVEVHIRQCSAAPHGCLLSLPLVFHLLQKGRVQKGCFWTLQRLWLHQGHILCSLAHVCMQEALM